MIDDMRVRNFSLATQRGYIRGVKMLAAHLRRPPDTATADELRSFQRHLAATGITPGVQNMTVSGLRFFFRFTVDKPDTTRHLVYTHQPQKLPRVLSSKEISQLLTAAPEPKDKAMLCVAYGAGLRAMEVVTLLVSDIDSKRIRDPRLDRLLVGSMSLFRTTPGSRARRCAAPADASRTSAAACAVRSTRAGRQARPPYDRCG